MAAWWTRPRETATARVAAASGFALLAVVAVMNTFNLAHFHRDLEASGGAAMYSDAIDRFAHRVARDDPDATAYFPDWGYVMPFVFVTRARLAWLDSVDPDRIARESCTGKPQVVVFTGAGNAAKFDVIASLAHQPPPAITTWAQRDGVPVFQSARYAPRTDCTDIPPASAPPAPEIGPGPAIAVAPAAASDCDFLSPFRATARWDAGNPALSYVEAWIAAPGAKSKPWTGGAERSHFVVEPLCSARAGRDGEPAGPRSLNPKQIRAHLCKLSLAASRLWRPLAPKESRDDDARSVLFHPAGQ